MNAPHIPPALIPHTADETLVAAWAAMHATDGPLQIDATTDHRADEWSSVDAFVVAARAMHAGHTRSMSPVEDMLYMAHIALRHGSVDPVLLAGIGARVIEVLRHSMDHWEDRQEARRNDHPMSRLY